MQKDDLVVDARQVFLKEVMGTQGRIRPLVPGFQVTLISSFVGTETYPLFQHAAFAPLAGSCLADSE